MSLPVDERLIPRPWSSVKDALADAETLRLELVPSGTRCICGEMAVNHDEEGCILGNGCYGFVAAGH